jgi:hypothetical protein
MHTVGDVTDGDGLGGALGEERLPHLARHLAMAPADPVGEPAHLDPEWGHHEGLVGVVRLRPPQLEEAGVVEPDLGGIVAED